MMTNTFETISLENLGTVAGGDGLILPREGESGHGFARSTLGLSPEQYDNVNSRMSALRDRGNPYAEPVVGLKLLEGAARNRAAQRRGGLGG
jgi:hypothetical protein